MGVKFMPAPGAVRAACHRLLPGGDRVRTRADAAVLPG